jgi:hypothetical protein
MRRRRGSTGSWIHPNALNSGEPARLHKVANRKPNMSPRGLTPLAKERSSTGGAIYPSSAMSPRLQRLTLFALG